MKNLFVLLILFGLTFQVGSAQNKIEHNKIEHKHMDLGAFNEVHVSQGISVEVSQGEHNRADITSNMMEYVTVKVENGMLKIKYNFPKKMKMMNAETHVTLTAKNMNKIKASSAGHIIALNEIQNESLSIEVSSAGHVSGKFKAQDIVLHVSSAGDFEGSLNAETLKVKASSSADILCNGNVDSLNILASSSADVDATALKAKNVKVKASSSSDVQVYASQQLSMKASSGADILYSTENSLTKLIVTSSSGGEIKEK